MKELPIIHNNGTSPDDLIEQWSDVLQAAVLLQDALGRASPNGRDYYPAGADKLSRAQEEHRNRALRLKWIMDDAHQIIEYVADERDRRARQ
jgi:hypothetical protein